MSEKDNIFAGKIKQTGVFDFKEFYAFTYDWLREEGYDVTEKTYSEKVAGEAKDIDINWEAKKKVSDYFQFMIKADWKIIGMKSVEVEKNGKRVKMNSAQIEIKFKGTLIKDYESRWENAPVWKFLRGVYDRYIIRERVREYETKLFGEVDELIAQCKSFLAIEAKH
ncbi:MAG: hypothetical protein ACP5OG_04445 [Candidatus Nanoarchaeia archaeon]